MNIHCTLFVAVRNWTPSSGHEWWGSLANTTGKGNHG